MNDFVADEPELIGYREHEDGPGKIDRDTEFTVDVWDPGISPGAILRIAIDKQPIAFCEVKSVDSGAKKVVVTPDTTLPGIGGQELKYWKPIPSPATVVPAIEFPTSGGGTVEASVLEKTRLYFPVPPGQTLKPSPQRASAFGVTGGHPAVVALAERWTSPPPSLTNPTPFIIDGVIGNWRHQLGNTASNPALSWEYWNGKGWWSLEILDGTERLASTGFVTFTVPSDIAESDWSGKTNFWIRSRLVGGDYGREEVKVTTTPVGNTGQTVQIVERSTDNIRAPQVLDLRVSYSIDNPVFPKFVLAEDSGTIRDQSDANRTGGAIVEAFVPLAVMLGRLSGTAASAGQPEDCPPECDCGTQNATTTVTQTATATVAQTVTAPSVATVPGASGRALFLGLNATLSGAPVNVLLLVEENDHTAFAPIKVEALVADRFVPIVADDATRALGESGVLTMTFAVPPTPRELFGRTLTWLRLVPNAATDAWKPTLRGAYLNAAWASSQETLTRELLGSSDRAPSLTVQLARPPVLHNTLELRVKEPLGEEERKALLDLDPQAVLSAVSGLPGDWVLWTQVVDPGDEAATAPEVLSR